MSRLNLVFLKATSVMMICAAAPVQGQTVAAPPAAPTALPFVVERLDGNQDGRISRREFVAGREARFTELDRDRDGILRRADFPGLAGSAPLATAVGRLFDNADRDGDGDITRDEVGLSGTPGFDVADADGNGLVDGPEIARLRGALQPRP